MVALSLSFLHTSWTWTENVKIGSKVRIIIVCINSINLYISCRCPLSDHGICHIFRSIIVIIPTYNNNYYSNYYPESPSIIRYDTHNTPINRVSAQQILHVDHYSARTGIFYRLKSITALKERNIYKGCKKPQHRHSNEAVTAKTTTYDFKLKKHCGLLVYI